MRGYRIPDSSAGDKAMAEFKVKRATPTKWIDTPIYWTVEHQKWRFLKNRKKIIRKIFFYFEKNPQFSNFRKKKFKIFEI